MHDPGPESSDRLIAVARGIAGGAVGGMLGHFLFAWLVKQQLYGMILPGALLGLGCGMASRIRSHGLGMGCAIAAIMLGIYSEWSQFPFLADDSFSFFLKNLTLLEPGTKIMIVLGGIIAYWFGVGRAV